MLAIKLKRIGKKKQASFRVVVMPKRSKLLGEYVEDLGWYNPHTDEKNIKTDRAEYWLSVGAQPTETVYNILVSAGVKKGAKITKHVKKAKPEKKK